jgi:formate--tetrahydrofolate ligase
MAMTLSDYTVTEAGFGSDLGAEKFLDIKCRSGRISPSTIVLVATIRALKYHGGIELADLSKPNPEAVQRGLVNLDRHIENGRIYGVPMVVAINRFVADTDEEIQVVVDHCQAQNLEAHPVDYWKEGGAGGLELARAVKRQSDNCNEHFTPVYELSETVEEKIEAVATRIYGAGKVEFANPARSDLKLIEKLGLQRLPVCIAKTQSSFSDDPSKRGRPEGFTIQVRQIEIAAGAGFLVPITGKIMRMPGLPAVPAAEHIDIDHTGKISGLF